MANQDIKMRVQYLAEFDTSKISEGLKDIKKQVSNANISDELKKQFEAAFNKLQVNIPALEKLTSKEDFNLKDIEALQKLLKEVTKDWENLNKVTDQIDLSKTFSAKDLEKINNLDKQIKQTQDNIQKARKELVDTFTKDPNINVTSKNVSDALTELFTVNPSEIDSKFKEIQEQFTQGIQQTQVELKNKLEHAKIVKTREDVIGYFFGKDSGVEFAGKSGPIVKQIQDITKAYREAAKAQDDAKMAEQIQKLNEVLTDTANFKLPEGYKLFGLPTQEDLTVLNSIGAKLGELKTLAETKEGFFTEEEARVLDLIKQKVDAEAQAALNAKNANDQLHGSTRAVGGSVQDLGNKTEETAEQQRRLQAQSEALNATFGGLIHRINSAISATAIFNKGMQITRNAIQSVKELDAAFTQIAIVSEQSGEQAWKLFDEFNRLAKQYSITTKDLTEGAKLFYQQGLNAADTMKMVEASTISAALGEVTMTEAANTLTAAIQGYNESASVAMDYTDKIAKVGAVSAADFNELSASMEKTASSAYTAGIDFDHLLGYLGKMIEVTREAPANLGTAMKTIIARFEDMKKDPMAILEDGVSANKVETALASIGIALRNSEGEFRELQDVFDELGMKWQSLTRNQQAYIATVAAGSRQQSRFLALMNNYDRTLDLIAESQNSAGAAAQQYATYQDSIAAAQARLTASWEKLYSKIVDNDIIKFAINGLTELLDLLSHIPPSITAIGVTIGALQLQQFLSDNGGLTKILTNLLGGGEKTGKQIALSFINKFTDTSYDELKKKSPTIIGGFETLGKNSIEALSSMTSGLFGVVRAIRAFISANAGILGIATLVTGAIALITYKLTEQKREYEKTVKKIQTYNKEYENLTNKTNNAKNLLDTYEDLSKKISLTDEEQTTLNNTIDELKDLYPELITATNDYGEAEIANIQVLKDRIMAEEKLAKIQRQKALESQRDILATDTKEWNQDDIAKISAKYAAQFFNAKDDLERAQQYTKSVPTAKQRKMRINWYQGPTTNSTNVLDFVNNKMYEQIEPRYQNDALKQSKEALNTMLDFYGLSNQISMDMVEDWEDVYDVAQRLSDIIKDAPIKIAEANKQMVDAKKNLEKINYLDLGFNNLNFSDNSSIYTSQKLIEDQIRSMFDQMDLDIWSEFLDINEIDPKDSSEFTNFIQEMLDVVTEENSIDITQLFKDFNSGKKTNIEFFDEFLNLAKQSGNSSAIAFANSFYEVLGQQLDKEKEKFVEYFSNFGIGKIAKSVSNDLQLGEGQIYQDYAKNYLADSNGNISKNKAIGLIHIPAEQIQQFEQEVKEAVEAGDASALVDIRTQWLETWGTIDEEVANLLVNGRIVEAFQQFSRDYVSEISEAASSLFQKKDYSSIDISEGVNYYSAFNESDGTNSFWDHAAIDENGKLQLDYYGQIKAAQKDINDRVQVYNDKIADAKAELATNTELTEDQKKELQDCIDYWEEAKKSAAGVGDQVKIVVKASEELNKTIIDYTNNLDKAVDSAANNADALKTSSNAAKEYEEVINVVEKLEDDMKKIGHVSRDTMDKLMAYGDFYQDFFTIDNETILFQLNEMVGNYASAADAVKAIARNRQQFELEIKKQEIEAEATRAEEQAKAYDLLAQVFYGYARDIEEQEGDITETKRQELANQYTNEITAAKDGLIAADNNYNELMQACADTYKWMSSLDAKYWESIGDADISTIVGNEIAARKAANAAANAATGDIINDLINGGNPEDLRKQGDNYKKMAESLRKYAESLKNSIGRLEIIDPTVYNELADKLEQAGNAGTEAGKAIADAIAEAADAIVKLNELVNNLKESLKDITIDIDPFTELFEEWEHEWDYFFNIKNFIGNKQRSRNLFSRVADAEWASPEDRLAMDDAIMGSYIGEFAARREYAEGLMADIVQKGTDMTEKYGQFGTFDPETMTWYQKDDELVKINEEQAQRVENINNLQRQQWEKNNELAAKEAELEILESEKDKYEDALSIIDDTIESLKEKEGIEADTSALEDEKKKIEDNLKATEDGIEARKDSIKDLEEEIKKIDFDLGAEQDAYDFWDNFVNGMDDDVSSLQAEIEEYFGNIDAMYEDIEGAWAQYTKYLEATMNTQQQLFDAIVENYQKEIDAKKKEYDELKQLDNEYLQSVKDNIAKEREAREDSKKQKSYQQSLQRAQLLQMDTSGAFRTELNELKNSIEQQREDLYDDLVDKQVEALEKEIEKRHELYDKEVAALEERLAYMQENASLLWEMVNEIVAQGSGAMMSTLEGTAEYMNSSELQREQLRNQWQYNTLASIKFTTDQWGKKQELVIKAMGEMAETAYPNYKKEVENNTEVLKKLNQSIEDYKNSITQGKIDVDNAMSSLVSSLSTEFTNYMNGWAVATSTLTGNVTVYGTAVNDMINSLSTNIQTLDGWNSGLSTSGGKIIKTIETYDEELAKKYAEIYKDYEDERNKYQGELDSLIQEIQEEISSAVEDAAEAIRKAVDSLTASDGSGDGNGGGSGEGGGGSNTPTNPEPNPGGGSGEDKDKWVYEGYIGYYNDKGTPFNKTFQNEDPEKITKWINESREEVLRKKGWTWAGSGGPYQKYKKYLQGGLANFTGPAWLDGTASSPERVLSPHQTKLFESMVSSLERASNNSNINSALGSSYNIGDINTSIQVAKLDNQTDINQLAKQVEDKIVKTIRNRVTISV